MTRKRLIQVLVAAGHSAAQALMIAIDYERGDAFARQWVETLP